MNTLVTGCAGFIGFHVSTKLLEKGHNIIGIDNLNDYYDVSLKEARLEILKKNKNFAFYKTDIAHDEIKFDIIPDKICHLAAQAGVRYSISNPLVYETSNSLGTLKILEYARNNKIPHVVFASSSSVYGDIKTTPFKEDMKTDTPVSLYAATKKANELYAYTYSKLYGINVTGLRFFTAYGPWGRPDMALFKFTQKIIDEEEIDVYNNGEMTRDFTYVEDIAEGIISALEKPFKYEIINLARGHPIQLIEFIHAIEDAAGKKAKINFMPMQLGDVLDTHGDISKAKNLLGYNPKTDVKEGVHNFVEWYKTYYKTN